MTRPSVGQVMALAPDGAVLKAGQKLAVGDPWSDAGCNARAVWGSCRGSAGQPYDVVCDLIGPAFKCSCPSRKSPCKHALGLLLLWAGQSPEVPDAQPPLEAVAWLAARAAKSTGGSIASAVAGKEAPEIRRDDGRTSARASDPEAAAARVAQRQKRIAAGMAELDRWLGDLVRHGLGHAQSQPYAFWDAMAARLVDAQAPAAATRVRRLAGVVRSGDSWPSRLLAQLARLHLLAAGWARYDQLPETTRADLRTAAGWPWPSEQVLAGDKETDRWYVLGRRVTEDEQIRAQRTWLWGLNSRRPAVIVDFARPGLAFAWELWPGNVLEADLARFPGSAPLRVLVAERRSDPTPAGRPPAWTSLSDAARARGRAVAMDPWLERWPLSVERVVPDVRRGSWHLGDSNGDRLPLLVEDRSGWTLLAASEGRPVQLMGEWGEDGVVPLTVWAGDRLVSL